ncbi:polysaccharide deacetylase family protein [Cytophagaceae bacterium DM2B3-1]|uniref:Polysaccharide deacetylase family protein n=1 Tax=Xanthocytophaga flava TaxID=3048013 RepID=A0ABT7CVX2_9BACT|nr:polysaccharide deacetylase family protein [Xanthocytophaga flavus]MDJ1497090.1 polysaccharide deacetylase family protein [Xanthocytophaga flavus]
METRRHFLSKTSIAGAFTMLSGSPLPYLVAPSSDSASFWPDNTRLVISLSMQFEAGGELDFGADSPFSGNYLPAGVPDLPARTWFAYGYKEGIPRMLDLWDKHQIKVTSHMVGQAVLNHPALAKEIVDRGHEGAAHGMSWTPQVTMSASEEKAFVAAGMDAIKRVTGQTPVGYNCNWLRRSVNTLNVLQELGFLYHIDDVSRDEPFISTVNEKDFVTVPYTLRCNDILLMEGRHFSSRQFADQLKDEFTWLYAESATKRRMMSVSLHDRIGGTPAMAQVMHEFISFAKKQKGVRFMRKDEIARFVLQDKHTLRNQ